MCWIVKCENINVLSIYHENNELNFQKCYGGLSRDLNPGPRAPEARIIPLDHWAKAIEKARTVDIRNSGKQKFVTTYSPYTIKRVLGCYDYN